MNKILKLTGVSMLAIVAATNAHSAGYTCEELVEYTSCNQGYYLNSGKCIESATCGAGNYIHVSCPDGYEYSDEWCLGEAGWAAGWDAESCDMDLFGQWYGPGCVKEDYEFSTNPEYFVASSMECSPCSAGTYQNTAGQYSCLTCPAGSECPTAGLVSHTLCEVGEYSSVGATACSTCPATGLTDKDGATVVATTPTTGSTSPAACIVDENVYFADTKGTYHYKSDCWYAGWDMSVTTEEQCASIAARESVVTDAEWFWDGEICRLEVVGVWRISSSFAPTTEEECNDIPSNAMGSVHWENNQCMCEYEWFFDENGLSCNAA